MQTTHTNHFTRIEDIKEEEYNQLCEELYNLRKQKKSAEESLLFGTYEYDVKNDKGYFSEGVYSLFGYKEQPDAIVNLAFFNKHLDPISMEESLENIKNTFTDYGSYSFEYNIIDTQNTRKRIQIIGNRLCNENKEVICTSGIIRDITIKYKQQLSLNEAITELQRSNKELEEFAYIASHDLQEPLRKIITFTDMLQTGYHEKLSGEGSLYIERICAAASSMRQLIENLLEFSRISRIPHHYSVTDLNQILKMALSDLDLTIEETQTEIIASELPQVHAIPVLVKQIFYNLLSNGIKFRHPQRNPQIRIETTILSSIQKENLKLSQDQNYYSISFEDNGIGFEDDYTQRIFQIFQRLHGRSKYPGSGIGLAICKKIAEQHKGTIYAESILDKGSKFHLILPTES